MLRIVDVMPLSKVWARNLAGSPQPLALPKWEACKPKSFFTGLRLAGFSGVVTGKKVH